jgi:hypothetical protein
MRQNKRKHRVSDLGSANADDVSFAAAVTGAIVDGDFCSTRDEQRLGRCNETVSIKEMSK